MEQIGRPPAKEEHSMEQIGRPPAKEEHSIEAGEHHTLGEECFKEKSQCPLPEEGQLFIPILNYQVCKIYSVSHFLYPTNYNYS